MMDLMLEEVVAVARALEVDDEVTECEKVV